MKKVYYNIGYTIVLCMVMYVLLFLLTSSFTLPCNATQKPEQSENWTIVYGQGRRNTNYTDCTASDNMIFFAYSEGNLVDAYNHRGEYLFTLFFQDYRNGSLLIQCDSNLLYVRTKLDTVFIFDGDQLVDTMTFSSAEEQGKNYFWFEGSNIYADRKNIYFKEDGRWIPKLDTPEILKESIPFVQLAPEIDRIVTIAGIVILFLIGYTLILYDAKKNTRQRKTL